MADKKTIHIPKIGSEARIGDVMVSVFSVIDETERCTCEIVWDYDDAISLHPFLLNALAIYKDSKQGGIVEINVSENLKNEFEEICFDNQEEQIGQNPNKALEKFKGKCETPICKFAGNYPEIDNLQTEMFATIADGLRKRAGGWAPSMAVSYLISELVCNIQEHSQASHGYMYAGAPESDDSLYICIADNGITIHGSYMLSGKPEFTRLIGQDHAEALRYSTKGISTKNRPDNESRGYGISTNLDMIVHGLGGDFFLLSGHAFFRCDGDGEQFVNLPEGMYWDGTIILVRIPLQQKDGFNVYRYIE